MICPAMQSTIYFPFALIFPPLRPAAAPQASALVRGAAVVEHRPRPFLSLTPYIYVMYAWRQT
jgi:hypothetical protein